MAMVAGVDGCPGGWAVVTVKAGKAAVRKIGALTDIAEGEGHFDIIAIDVPIGLLDAYEVGGRACDRLARGALGRRASSVFPAPVRPALAAASWEEACERSRRSGPRGRSITKQTFAILPKIREVDRLLQTRKKLRSVVREVHPELSFCELAGKPMVHRKASPQGRAERRQALARIFPELPMIENGGRQLGLPTEDILDAAVACWSALRLAAGQGRSLPDSPPRDITGLPMAIWV